MIKQEMIDQIREQTNIVQLISEYLPLKKAGKYYKTLCPFHSEKSPSFYVSQERQIYHCFGCGVGGSVYTFLMQYEKLSFPEAIKKLATKLGIAIEEDKSQYPYHALYDACEFATKFYAESLENSQLATEYLKYRKISIETIKRFRLGFAPSGNFLCNSAKKHSISEENLVKAGLAVKKEDGFHDWFFNRIIFPVFSISGKVIGFGARTLDANTEPKYINTPETAIFRKGANLYGLYQAKNYLYQNMPILVEGNFDLLALANQGINNVVAPLGTALTLDQALLIRRYASQVIIAFDGDYAGQTATLRTIETLLKANIDPRIAMLEQDFDPDKYIKTYGKEKFDSLIAENIDFIDFILKIKPSNSVIDKRLRLKEIIELIAMINENVSQELYLNKVADLFKISKDTLLNQIKRENKSPYQGSWSEKPYLAPIRNIPEKQLLSLIVSIPEYGLIAKQELPYQCFTSEETQELLKIVYENIDLGNFSSAKLIDAIDKPQLKQLVADLSFQIKSVPTKNEFIHKIKTLKASWYYKLMTEAKNKGDSKLLEKLTLEHYNLKKDLSYKRNNNNEK